MEKNRSSFLHLRNFVTASKGSPPSISLWNCLPDEIRLYIVGSNNTETRFRVLKIDRTEPRELHIVDDKVEYSRKEIRELLTMIDTGNRSKINTKSGTGLNRTVSAFGIAGFIRFLEGYYIMLITRRRKIAILGFHVIYKVEDTIMIYIPNETVRQHHPDEQKYLRMFLNMDLSSNFYFSYSYDLTHSLQFNMMPCHITGQNLTQNANSQPKQSPKISPNKDILDNSSFPPGDLSGEQQTEEPEKIKSDHNLGDTEDGDIDEEITVNFLDSEDVNNEEELKDLGESVQSPQSDSKSDRVYGVKPDYCWKYVWNQHMLHMLRDCVHYEWLLPLIHGFVGQSNMIVFGKPIYLTLIARRSNQFAGTRFLKRGANVYGQVANEVETEQIVYDSSLSSQHKGRFTSFVQLRGSIPLFWSQDNSAMVPRPQITIEQADPYCHLAGQHFNTVLSRYGSPVIVLNLVKKREKKPHESVLREELINTLEYLNQFLPPEHSIQYIGFDMARVSKSKTSNVMVKLAEIAESCVRKTGFFLSTAIPANHLLRPNPKFAALKFVHNGNCIRQHGVVRTNCVDCLDRTNTAQFAIGKCVLGFQLYVLGVIDNPSLDFDTDCMRMLEELYEDHGDTLALQYGGSQLVHRIKSYRKVAPITSSSRDIMQTLSRYYSNAFSDYDKQQAINLFLGLFRPKVDQPSLWELPTDFYLHNPYIPHDPCSSGCSYSQWWSPDMVKLLPAPPEEEVKGENDEVTTLKTFYGDEKVNDFSDYYRPYELTNLEKLFCFNMPNSIKGFMPKSTTNCSPFCTRKETIRSREEMGSKTSSRSTSNNRIATTSLHVKLLSSSVLVEVNPNISGKDSTSSVTSAGSEGSQSSSEDSDIDGDLDCDDIKETCVVKSPQPPIKMKSLFQSLQQTYGVAIKEPDKTSLNLYKRFAQIGSNACNSLEQQLSLEERRKTVATKQPMLLQEAVFPLDSSYSVEPPAVNAQSKDIYETYVRRGLKGADVPSKRDMLTYNQYIYGKYS